MKSKSLLWQAQLGYLALLALALTGLLLAVLQALFGYVQEAKAKDLHLKLVLATPGLIWFLEDASGLEGEMGELANLLQARLQLVDPQGKVLADSTGKAGGTVAASWPLAPHRHWQVRVTGWTRGLLIAAERVNAKDRPYLVATQQISWGELLDARLLGPSLLAWMLIFGLAAAASWIWIWRLLLPIGVIRQGAQALAQGELGTRLHAGGSFEAEALCEDLNHMAATLSQRLGQLTDRQRQLEAIFTGIDEGLILLDGASRVLNANPAAARMLEFSSAFALGKPLVELHRHTQLVELVTQALANKQAQEQELELLHSGRRIRAATLPLKLAQEPEGAMLLVLRDLTQIHRLERIRKEFVANVSHELKTPITSIQGFAETLLDGAMEDPEDRERFLQIIHRHALRLSSIIEDLLSLARIEESALGGALQRSPKLLAQLAEQALHLVSAKAEQKGIRIQIHCPPDLEAWMNADLMEQCVTNLLDNAIKYSEANTLVELTCQTQGPEVLLVVADQGEGIPEPDRERIFERFYRVDKSRSRATGGTGLGLSIVKNIVTLHQGRIWVEPNNPRGSRFCLSFPLVAPPGPLATG